MSEKRPYNPYPMASWSVEGINDPVTQAVMGCLGSHCNYLGETIIGVDRLAKKTKYAKRTVQYALAALQRMGRIKREMRQAAHKRHGRTSDRTTLWLTAKELKAAGADTDLGIYPAKSPEEIKELAREQSRELDSRARQMTKKVKVAKKLLGGTGYSKTVKRGLRQSETPSSVSPSAVKGAADAPKNVPIGAGHAPLMVQVATTQGASGAPEPFLNLEGEPTGNSLNLPKPCDGNFQTLPKGKKGKADEPVQVIPAPPKPPRTFMSDTVRDCLLAAGFDRAVIAEAAKLEYYCEKMDNSSNPANALKTMLSKSNKTAKRIRAMQVHHALEVPTTAREAHAMSADMGHDTEPDFPQGVDDI